MPYDDIVDEAVAAGWIDSRSSSIDTDRPALLVTPRNPVSRWSARNKQRVERLTAAGLMQPAGLAVVADAKRSGTWSALIARTISGGVLLVAGAAMLVLPGPGLVVIVAGQSLLAVDYVWARRLRGHATEHLAATGRTIRRAATAHRGRRHDDGRDCDGAADTDDRDVRERDRRRGVEHPTSEVRS